MNSLTIINANIVTGDRIISGGTLQIDHGLITGVFEANQTALQGDEVIDAKGKWLMPGIIDLHTDAMDVEICPRPGADFPIDVAFQELERKMSTCGITTVFHSLHMGYKAAEKNTRSRYSREEVFEKVFQSANSNNLINNLIHLRFELTGTYHYDAVFELIDAGYINLLSIMDHTPGQGQVKVENFIRAAKREGKSEAEALLMMEEQQNRDRVQGEQLEQLINKCKEHHISLASHDDDSEEKVTQMHNLGIKISEFPINYEAALKAKELGMITIGGASNILRGGSLSGNMDVKLAVGKGLIDCLCSDYYPSSILHAGFMLYHENISSLPEIARLWATNPAKAVGIDTHTGSIENGKFADLIVIDEDNKRPFVTHTIVKGNVSASASLLDRAKTLETEEAWPL